MLLASSKEATSSSPISVWTTPRAISKKLPKLLQGSKASPTTSLCNPLGPDPFACGPDQSSYFAEDPQYPPVQCTPYIIQPYTHHITPISRSSQHVTFSATPTPKASESRRTSAATDNIKSVLKNRSGSINLEGPIVELKAKAESGNNMKEETTIDPASQVSGKGMIASYVSSSPVTRDLLDEKSEHGEAGVLSRRIMSSTSNRPDSIYRSEQNDHHGGSPKEDIWHSRKLKREAIVAQTPDGSQITVLIPAYTDQPGAVQAQVARLSASPKLPPTPVSHKAHFVIRTGRADWGKKIVPKVVAVEKRSTRYAEFVCDSEGRPIRSKNWI
ncbi:hypothetical protein FRC03_007753 [Tulasnella sp. 419]|nr:hypothetical protein FRC03_007753 [Tulasnella sp. 419]